MCPVVQDRRRRAGCSSALKQTSTSTAGAGGSASGGTIKIGFVSPQTGQLAVFTQSNGYVLGQVRSALAKGLTIGGKKYSVEVIAADSQSSSARAATVTSQLVQQNSVDFLIGTAHAGDRHPGVRPGRSLRRALRPDHLPVGAVVLQKQRRWRVQSGAPQLVVIDNSELPAVPVASQMQML